MPLQSDLNILQQLEALFLSYPDIPQEAILKQDLLRCGLYFEKEALSLSEAYKPKDYFIFSFDLATLSDLEKQGQTNKPPEEIRFFNQERDWLPTIVSVRLNPDSPYIVKKQGDKVILTCQNEILATIEYHPNPPFHSHVLSSKKKLSEIAPVLEWGYLIYITAFRLCQYWGEKEECRFCDINANYRQQKNMGRPYTGIKSIADIIEALEHINKTDTTEQTKAITLTGGSITDHLQGKKEVDFYLEYIQAIKENFQDRWIIKGVLEAFTKEDCQKLADAGMEIYHPNYEVWGESLFSQLCPGKTKLIGYQNWINRILDSAKIFGSDKVIPNFVAGIELAKPYGFSHIDDALKITQEGLDFFMSHKILPRFTTWCPEPLSFLGKQTPPPLEYYVKLLRLWRNTKEKYNLPHPQGYGNPGRGNAVFSVSAFMDVIR